MVKNGLRLKTLAISLLNTRTDRDKQKKVGASQISNPCTKHLAMALAGVEEEPSKYWLGGKVGTAVHSAIEEAIAKNADAEELQDAMVEQKIILGEIDGYGVISSKPDLVLPRIKHLVDWKTSTREKTKKIQKWVDGTTQDDATTYTMQKYIGQTQLYAWGLNNSGTEVQNISLVFINRDGTNEADVVEYTFEYDESIALALWDRLKVLWEELQSGVHPESYAGHPNCFSCSVNGLV